MKSLVTEYLRERVRVQPNTYTCSVSALRHALLAYGEAHSIAKLSKLAEVTEEDGADEGGIAQAAEALGYSLGHVLVRVEALAKEVIRNRLHDRAPSLVCLDAWDHWCVVLHVTARHVTIADSSRPGPVLQDLNWREFFRRWAAWTGELRFDLYPLLRKKETVS